MTHDTPDPSPVPSPHLGRDVVRRLRLPGPPPGRPLPSRVGSLASSVQRFAAATSRPVDIRRALMGPGTQPGETRPPRWWTAPQPSPDGGLDAASSSGRLGMASSSGGFDAASPSGSAGSTSDADGRAASGALPGGRAASGALPGGRAASGALPGGRAASASERVETPTTPPWHRDARPAASSALPPRELPRAARAVDNESSYTPGGMLGRLQGQVVRVRRHEEVAASGGVFSSADRTRMNTEAVRRRIASAAAAETSGPVQRKAAPSSSSVPAQPPAPSAGPASVPAPSAPAQRAAAQPSSSAATSSAAAPHTGPASPGQSAAVTPAGSPTPGVSPPAPPVARAGSGSVGSGAVQQVGGPAASAGSAPARGGTPSVSTGRSAEIGSGSAPAFSGGPGGSTGEVPRGTGAVAQLKRASWQLRPRVSRLAEAHRTVTAPAVGAVAGTVQLRRSMEGSIALAPSTATLWQHEPTPAVRRETWAASSSVVRRRNLERAEQTGSVAQLRRRDLARATGPTVAPAAESVPGEAGTAGPVRALRGAPSNALASGPSAATRGSARQTTGGVQPPVAAPSGSAAATPAPTAADQLSSSGADPASPARAVGPTGSAAGPAEGPSGAHTGLRDSVAGSGSAQSGGSDITQLLAAPDGEHRQRHGLPASPTAQLAARPLAGSLGPMADVLATRRGPSRGAGRGSLSSGLGDAALIRPSTGNLGTLAPAGPDLLRRTAAHAVPGLAAAAASGGIALGRATTGAAVTPRATPGNAPSGAGSTLSAVGGTTGPGIDEARGANPAGRAASDGAPAQLRSRRSRGIPQAPAGVVPLLTPSLRAPAAGASSAPAPAASGWRSASPTSAPAPAAAGTANGRAASVRPPVGAPAAAPAAPSVPASALADDPVVRRLLGDAGRTSEGSLVERTAAAFARDRASGPAAPVVPAPLSDGPGPTPGLRPGPTAGWIPGHPAAPAALSTPGVPMTTSSWARTGPSAAAHRTHAGPAADPQAAASADALGGAQLDAVVDAVVERIERRVIDELERRGRRDGRSW